jgi:hypothetical protein
MDVNGFISLLPKTHKKQKVQKYFCTLYKCVVGDVEEHEDGEKHSRLLEIMDILPMLQQHGIGMYAPYALLLLMLCCSLCFVALYALLLLMLCCSLCFAAPYALLLLMLCCSC